MINIDKILCPVDFFAASDKAVGYAAGLAEIYNAKIYLLHAVVPVVPVAYEFPLIRKASPARCRKPQDVRWTSLSRG
jgi:nucleotide-binding universal stress UspA family protein